jgi:hypothetical protein
MAKSFIYSEDAIIYQHKFKTAEGHTEYIGTDPTSQDRTKLYRWADVPRGWDSRELHDQPVDDMLTRIHNNAGTNSGWPGAVPLELPKRPVGRPPGPPRTPAEPREVLHVSIKRTSMLQVLQLAALNQQMPNEWAAGVIEAALQAAAEPPA